MEISINVSEKQLSFINKEEILCLKPVSEVSCEKNFELGPEYLDCSPGSLLLLCFQTSHRGLDA